MRSPPAVEQWDEPSQRTLHTTVQHTLGIAKCDRKGEANREKRKRHFNTAPLKPRRVVGSRAASQGHEGRGPFPRFPQWTRGSEDNGNTFITTIRDLRLEDTGTYWCGIHRFLLDTYVKVYLKVNKVVKSDVNAVKEAISTRFTPTAWPTDFENEISRGESISDQLTCIGAGLGVAVLVLALVLLTFCRIKRRRAAFALDKNQSTNEFPGDPRKNGLLPASLTNPHPDSAIYSNVSGFPKPSKAQDQPDESVSVPSSPEQPGVFYSTVSYNNDSKGVALKTDTDSVMYSTIQKTQ
ncbi:CMRF35-like molecule 1 [Gadus chalcogrammus]|uniref:CMRF35-like molecule 1 n=1 Tax=Gadus chalcogrammus TaxID=1042646 RepID=UPI0024C25EDF|nr:CMRF35-like molecule 1 [Gadus chalcogrammus]